MIEHSKFYCLTIVRSENDYFWFTVESDYMSLFIIKFYRKAKKIEKLLKKGLFTVYGFVPSLFMSKLVTKLDFVDLNYDNYRRKCSEQIRELKI